MIDTTKSPYVKPPGEPVSWHLLEPYLHGIAGTQGIGMFVGFKLEVNRDISLVNKQWNILKDEHCIPPLWWSEKHKGMVQQEDGCWLLQDRDEYDF
uniref:Phospholipase A1 n=1 Tax=Solanum chacoense TaxID=4108 RepID=A0A0V0GU58_SOLCH